MSHQQLGEFEHSVLLAILQVGEGAYGVAVMEELRRRTGRRVSRGAIYATLDRLQAKGLVRSELGAPTAERGGRAKRLLSVTPRGLEALRQSRATLRELWRGLETMLDRVD